MMTMKALLNHLNRGLRSPVGLGMAGIASMVTVVGVVVGASSPPAIPEVQLSSEPLYARGYRAKPALTLALSVEYPTVGAAYVKGGSPGIDDTYDPAIEYVGYFDPNGCYHYDEARRYFVRAGAAAARGCSADDTWFSGNFMNWAATSAIDILRYSLTGGDRFVDTQTQTVLQRAVLRKDFFNSTNFPAKLLKKARANGAIPKTLRASSDTYVANCLNRIYFGIAQAGDCDNPGDNGKLSQEFLLLPGTSETVEGDLPGDFETTSCAAEWESCTLKETRYVAYGAKGKYVVKSFPAGKVSCTNTTFGDPIQGTLKACYLSKTPPDSFFYSRVQVCDAADAASRPALCTLQPSNSYKPTGNLQRYSDQMRVAVFGYINDDSLDRYGGVLRAPMKYLGPKHFNESFTLISTTNPKREWDENTGVFFVNPEDASEGNSGAINYLNKFGRTGTVLGDYKVHDPVAELYYEALRYLQGLPPTPAATTGLTARQKDGFPVYTDWADPHPAVADLPTDGTDTYSCVKNSILTIGDVNTHADKTLPGNPTATSGDTVWRANPAANEPDFHAWTKVVGAFEDPREPQSYVDGKGVTRVTTNPSTVNRDNYALETQMANKNRANGACCNDNRYYMVGAAYWANTHDIRAKGLAGYPAAKARPGMRATTYAIDVNEYGEQSLEKLFKQNQFYLAAKYGGFTDRSQTGNPFLDKDGRTLNDSNWARPVPKTAEAANGGMFAADGLVAKNYFQGRNAKDLLAALDEVFATAARAAGSIAGAALSSARLTTDAAVYQGSFDPQDWSGDLMRLRVTTDSAGKVDISTADDVTVTRFASKELNKLSNAEMANRKIFVGRTVPDATGTATEFTWDQLDADHKTALKTPRTLTPVDSDDTGRLRLNYLRGDRSQEEGGKLRRRGSRLGDIINSGAVYSGAPAGLLAGSAYDEFYNTYKDRTHAVYVGANDGMLHAFNANTMAELFAYIPSFVVKNLRDFTLPTYGHRSFVDATPAVAEAKVGDAWKTVLVSGAGAGGQGVFALDVSSPTAFTARNVLWEFTDRDDPSIGNVVGRPQILRLRTTATSGAGAKYKYFAVVAGGVNNYSNDGRFSATGKPAIFILDLAKQSNATWSLGVNYFKIELPEGNTSKANGVVGFAAVPGSVGELDLLYAGDLQGNLWKFRFSEVGSAHWTAEGLSAFKSGTTPTPLFVASDADGVRQPITAPPVVAYGPGRGYIVAFGTGKLLETDDLAAPYKTQSYYAVYDNRRDAVPNRRYLATVRAAGNVLTGTPFTWGVPANESAMGVRAGWFFDFPGTAGGERQISGIEMIGSHLVFGSVEPAANGCGDGGGRIYFADLGSGAGTFTTSTVGIQGAPLVLKMGTDTVTDSSSDGRATRTVRYQIIYQGSGGMQVATTADGGQLRMNDATPVQQRSWRQIFNYDEIKNKP
jgi:type IV pilus assembly protein PilY1